MPLLATKHIRTYVYGSIDTASVQVLCLDCNIPLKYTHTGCIKVFKVYLRIQKTGWVGGRERFPCGSMQIRVWFCPYGEVWQGRRRSACVQETQKWTNPEEKYDSRYVGYKTGSVLSRQSFAQAQPLRSARDRRPASADRFSNWRGYQGVPQHGAAFEVVATRISAAGAQAYYKERAQPKGFEEAVGRMRLVYHGSSQ